MEPLRRRDARAPPNGAHGRCVALTGLDPRRYHPLSRRDASPMNTAPVDAAAAPRGAVTAEAAAARSPRSSPLPRAAAIVVAAVFVVLELASFAGSGPPRRFNDTNGYMRVSEAPLASRAFLAGTRPIAVPLLYRALAQRDATIVRAQSVLSVAGWLALALSFAGLLRVRWVAGLAAAAVCAFSLVVPVNQWDWVLLSESLSLSLFAAAAALSLRLAAAGGAGRAPGKGLVAAWGACCLLFALTRDVNVYVLACGWALLAVLAARAAIARGWRSPDARWRASCLLVLTVVLGASQLLATNSGRWKLPLLNVLLRRVISSPEVADEFASRYGMPRNPEVARYAGRFGWHRVGGREPMVVRFFTDDPALADFRAWILERGVASYARYLVVDQPMRALRVAAHAFATHGGQAAPNRRYGKGAGSTGWTRALSRVLHPQLPRPVLLWTLLVAAGALLAWRSPAARVPAAAVLLLAVTVAAHAFIAYHGDASNVDRHIAFAGIGLRLGLLLLLLTLLDRIAARTSGPGAGPPAANQSPGSAGA